MYKHLFLLFCLVGFTAHSQTCGKKTVYFKSNKAVLTKEYQLEIDSLLSRLSPDTTYLFELHGRTDNRKEDDYNTVLAQKRIGAVKEYIFLRHKKATFIELNHGESVPVSEDHKLNRCVDIYFLPLQRGDAIVLKGSNGEKVSLGAYQFRECGYCTSNVRVTSELKEHEMNAKNEMVKRLNTRIETDCHTINQSECIEIELRIPSHVYNSPDSIKLPRPLYVYNCCSTRKDSIRLKEIEEFPADFDTVTNEYIVQIPCYEFYNYCMCCDSRTAPCYDFQYDVPTSFSNLHTFLYKQIYTRGRITRGEFTFIDTTNFKMNCPDHLIYSYGKRNGELVFTGGGYSKYDQISVYKEQIQGRYTWFDHFLLTLKTEDYEPLHFNDTLVRIKVSRKMNIDSMGYFLAPFHYYTPYKQIKTRVFEAHLLDNQDFALGVHRKGQLYAVQMETMQSKFKKKKKMMKVKLRKIDLAHERVKVEEKDLPE